MKDGGRMRWAGLLLVGMSWALVGRARAFDAQEFSPAIDPEGYYSVYSSRTAPRGRFHIGIWYNFDNDPISSHEFNDAFPNQLPRGQRLQRAAEERRLLGGVEAGVDLAGQAPLVALVARLDRRVERLDAIGQPRR